MNKQNKHSLTLLLVLQTLITIFFGFALSSLVVVAIQRGAYQDTLPLAVKYLPEFVILTCSLLPQFALLLKHKLHSQDGEILPMLFTITSLQASLIVEEAVTTLGYVFIFPDQLLYLQRFSLVASAALFLLSALRYYGFPSSNMGMHTTAFLTSAAILSVVIPKASRGGVMNLTSSPYEVYLQIAVLCFYGATVVTFIITTVKDRTSLNLKRSIAFIAMAIALYIATLNNLYTSIASIVLYIPGSIVLLKNAGDSL